MKIIKYPEGYKNDKLKPCWTEQDICPYCNAVLEYTDLDINLRIGHRRYFIKCAYCFNILEIFKETHKITTTEIKF